MKRVIEVVALSSLGLALAACPPPPPPCQEGDDECYDAGEPPPDLCNDAAEALGDPQCALTLGEPKEAFLSFSGDQDWYLAQMPQLTARSLVRLSGGYAAPNTAVNLTLNLLREDGSSSLARKVDQHGQAQPRPIDIVVPFSESGAKLLVLVSDEGAGTRPNYDAKSPYSVKVEVVEDPDANEPNDTTPTVIPLSPQAGALAGQATGYLATDGDVDRFELAVPSGRKVIYLHLTAPRLSPPPPYRLSYALYDPTGKPVAEGAVSNEFLAVDLATARLSTAGGDYRLVVQAYRSPNVTGTLPGDLRLQYTLDLEVFDEVDPNEPNDSSAQAHLVSLSSPGAVQTLTGRLGYLPDPDWYAIELPAHASPTVLRYRLTPGSGEGRFPPLSPVADRQLRVFTEVTGANPQGACQSDAAVCPKGYDANPGAQPLVETFCGGTPARCLWAERREHPEFARLRNFEGTLPVPARSAPVRLYLVFEDEGNDFADDLDYTLRVEWLADSDEQSRSGLPSQTQATAIVESASFPSPPSTGEVSGDLSHGYGRTLEFDLNNGPGVRGPSDYDAVSTDTDRFQLDFPTGLTAPHDRAWTLEWEVLHLPDGGKPSDLAVELEFCDGDAPGGQTSCVPVASGRTMGYSGGQLLPWWSASDRFVLWDRQVSAASTTVTAQPPGCFCMEPRFIRAGRFFMTVTAVDRRSYEPTQYRLRTGLSDYPKSFGGADGGTQSCPPVPADGGAGCRFTR